MLRRSICDRQMYEHTEPQKHYYLPLYSISTVTNVKNNEIRIEKNNILGHNLLLHVLSSPLKFVSHYAVFFPVHGTNKNVLNCLKHSRLSRKWTRTQNNVTRTWGKWTIMREESEEDVTRNTIFLYSYLFILYIREWKQGISNNCSDKK